MKRAMYLAIAAALLALSAAAADAALPAIITGTVTNSAGKPVANAKVSVKGKGAVLTKANGSYLISSPAGLVTLCSVATGYSATCTPRFAVKSGETKTKNFTLYPK